jgi:integrase
MVNSEYPTRIEFLKIGRHMSRERYQRGSLKKVGKTRKMWRGRWHVYVKQADGSEKICKREKILGPASEFTKAEAQTKLDAEIAKSTTAGGLRLSGDAAFRDVWKRYVELKSASWSTATRRAICSVFEQAAPRPKQKARSLPSVLSLVGDRRLDNLTRDPLQDCLNRLAAAGASYSYVHKARTHLAAALEYAVDERLIPTNPARKITIPTQITALTCERFYSVEEIRRLNEQAHGRERLILRLFIDCGLRAQELFALRANDIEPLQVRIDEALHETERGAKRLGSRTKTRGSRGYVAISAQLERELRGWVEFRNAGPDDLLFPTDSGTPFRIAN